jgi:hypothetical protein
MVSTEFRRDRCIFFSNFPESDRRFSVSAERLLFVGRRLSWDARGR